MDCRLAGEGINAPEGDYGQPVRRRLLRLCWILVLAALVGGCTQASAPTPSPSPSRTVDYAAMETVIEDKINSGSVSLSTINAVLISIGG